MPSLAPSPAPWRAFLITFLCACGDLPVPKAALGGHREGCVCNTAAIWGERAPPHQPLGHRPLGTAVASLSPSPPLRHHFPAGRAPPRRAALGHLLALPRSISSPPGPFFWALPSSVGDFEAWSFGEGRVGAGQGRLCQPGLERGRLSDGEFGQRQLLSWRRQVASRCCGDQS